MPWDYTDEELAANQAVYDSLTSYQKDQIGTLLSNFPTILDRAQADYAKFQLGYSNDLFTAGQVNTIGNWFQQFPSFWQTIRDNYTVKTGDGRTDALLAGTLSQADRFVADLQSSEVISHSLGNPLIIAGVIVAGVLGVAGIIWGISYIQQQDNISKTIDGVVAGKIPASVLQAAIDKQKSTSSLGDIGSILKYGAIGLALYMAFPLITQLVSSVTSKKQVVHAKG